MTRRADIREKLSKAVNLIINTQNPDGGWGEYIRIPSEWAVPLPHGLTLFESMALGTAGFTAALSLLKLEQAGVRPGNGEILVYSDTRMACQHPR